MNEGVMRVSASERGEVMASQAKLHIRVEGETFVFGNAALTRSREVAEMMGRLKELGLKEEEAQVTSVYTRTQSGFLTKGTKAIFKLLITVSNLANLPEYLGVMNSQKNVELGSLEWVYEEDEKLLELSTKAISKAHAKAQAMAGAIGYRITGIRACSDSSELPHTTQDVVFQIQEAAPARMRAQAATLDMGTEFKASKEIGASVVVEFTVAKVEG